MGHSVLRWDGANIITNGTCWDCIAIPKKGDTESIQGFINALEAAPKRLKPQVQEVLRVMEKLRLIVDSIDTERPWLTPHAKELDTITFDEWIRKQTESELARSLLSVASNTQGATNTPAMATSVLHIARQIAAAPQVESPEKWLVVGGCGQVPALLARDIKKLGVKIKLGVPVYAIHQTSDGGGGVTLEGAKNTQIIAKYAIVAMPPHLAGRIHYSPPMPALRDLLTQHMHMGTLVKCVAIYDMKGTALGTTHVANVTTTTSVNSIDNPALDKVSDDSVRQSVWGKGFVFDPKSSHHVRIAFDISPPPPKGLTMPEVGVLATFVNIDASQPWSLTKEGREKHVLAGLKHMFGPDAAKPVGYVENNWADEPYVGGAYSSVMPMGGWTTFGPALTAPVGRVHWAGTEASPKWPGFFEGAIVAGETAAKAVGELLKGADSGRGISLAGRSDGLNKE